jgi:hypothetical protein
MVTSSIATENTLRTRALELTIAGAPPVKTDFVYYTVTGLAIRYENTVVTGLYIIGIAEDTGEAERITVRLDLYDMWLPWVRDLVEKHRPTA